MTLASWFLLLKKYTGLICSKSFAVSLQTKQNKRTTKKSLLCKSQRHIKSILTLNKGPFTLYRFNLTDSFEP